MATDDNSQGGQLVKLAVLGGAGFAAYALLYKPWAQEQRLKAEIAAQTQANLAKGMGIEEAAQKAISAACQAAAAAYGVPPAMSGGACGGVGILAEKGIKALGKGAIIAGRVVGKGIGKGVMAVGHTGAVVGRGIGTGAKATASAVKFVSYTAPKKVVTTTAKAVKFVSYTAPKKVVTKTAKVAVKGVKSVVKSVSHGFGLWGLDPDATVGRRPRRAGGAFPVGSTRRQALPNLVTQRKRRSGTGIQAGRPRRGGGAAFYTRHLK